MSDITSYSYVRVPHALALKVLVNVQNICAFCQHIYFIEILISRSKFAESSLQVQQSCSFDETIMQWPKAS